MSDPLKPSLGVLVKLGSIAVHVEEALSSRAHHFDIEVTKNLLADKEVSAWIKQMDKLALLPKKRN